MGLLDSNSTRNTTTNNLSQDASDKRLIETNHGNIGGNVSLNSARDIDNVTLSLTDFGAVEGSLTLAESAVESVAELSSEVLNRQSVNNQNSLGTLTQLATEIKTDGNSQMSKVIQNVIISVVAVGGIALIVSRVKK